MKIRTKIYLFFLALGIFLTVAGVIIYYLFFSINFEKTTLKNLETLVNIKENNVHFLLDQNFVKAKATSDFISFRYDDGYFYYEDANIELNNIERLDANIDEVFLLDEQGVIITSSNLENVGNVIGIDEIDIYLNKLSINGIERDEQGYYYLISIPIIELEDSHYQYLFVIRYNTDSLIKLLDNGDVFGNTGEILLGAKITDSKISFINDQKFGSENYQDLGFSSPMRDALSGNKGVASDSLDYRGISVMAAYSYIEELGVGLVIKVDRSEALNFVSRMLLVSFMLGLAIIFFVYVATNVISRKLSKPIEKLKKAVRIVSEGNLDYEINIGGNDEITDTANAFNKMSKAIKEAQEKTNKQIDEQTKSLRDQQMAILNILEDVEAEKEKVADTAKELEKFKQAVENTSDHVVITDENGVIIYVNRAVEVITGFSEKEVLGTKVGTKDNWGGLMGQDFYQNLWDTVKKEKKSFSGYINNIRKNGEEYEVLANISPVFDAGGNVIFFVGIERDFTKEREIDRAKSEFVSLASHQLRTPLSTVNWYAEILLSEDAGKINEEQREYLNEVYKGNQRMVNLVNALLNVSRIDLGTLSIDPEPTDLVGLAKSVLNELELKIKERHHKVVKIFDNDIPNINLDPKMMRIVWQNYLTNAVKYTRENGVIEVGIKKKKTLVEIYVKDNGMGIPEVQQDEIFKKLFRADNARESETDGTGLGLYIVKSIVEEFGGKVWFKSKEGEGATFFATIPLKGVKAKVGSKGLEYVD